MVYETSYLGLTLKTPIVVGSGPFDNPASALDAQTAGAGMLVMHSLFEEQFAAERAAACWNMEHGAGPDEYEYLAQVSPEEVDNFVLRPEQYFQRVAQLKQALSIPVVGSINGTTPGNWVLYAQEMEHAGADAIELNLYDPVMDPDVTATEIEQRLLQIVKLVRRAVQVPVAVKLCPFYTSVAHLARELDNLGIDGLVLFNRFYQGDYDIEGKHIAVSHALRLSTSDELPVRVRWMAALYGKLRCSLALTGGVHTADDLIKAILAGANAVQVVSAIIRKGTKQIGVLQKGLEKWMREHEIETLDHCRGALSLQSVLNPQRFDRASYVDILRQSAVAP